MEGFGRLGLLVYWGIVSCMCIIGVVDVPFICFQEGVGCMYQGGIMFVLGTD